MDDRILIVLTLDCERPTAETDVLASGPPDRAAARQWTRSFEELCNSHGYPVTYFIHPELADTDADEFLEFEANGACLGLHLHPWRQDFERYPFEMGSLNARAAREAISEASLTWSRGFGRKPEYFRPGALSANDTTFPVLTELGFLGGSVSIPGRVFPTVFAAWAGAALDPHRAHESFRLLEGMLPFANMPVSVDTSNVQWQDGRWFHWDLRPDFDNPDIGGRVRRVLKQTLARSPKVPVLNVLTHNDHDFADLTDPVSARMHETLRQIREACNELGLRPEGATMKHVATAVLAHEGASTVLERRSGRIMFSSSINKSFDL